MLNLYNISEIKFRRDKKYIIFGAGKAGKLLELYLEKEYSIAPAAFCDNNKKLENENQNPPIISVKKAVEMADSYFIVSFYHNDEMKLESAFGCLKRLGVDRKKILPIDIESLMEVLFVDHIKTIIDPKKVYPRQKIDKVKKIIFLAYGFNKELEKRKGGGPIGAMCMQKKYLGSLFKNIELVYPYYKFEKKDRIFDIYPYISAAIDYSHDLALKNKDSIYIANDIFSAYGLYLAGANYSIIFHAQGDVVNEVVLWGKKLSEKEKKLIYEIENRAIQNASYVMFPSSGAEKYFRKSLPMNVEFETNPPLYNAINDFPTVEKISGIESMPDYVTFLSIGQMTKLKGMDRIPEFIKKYADISGKKVRWIVVADGVLKDNIRKHMNCIIDANANIEYINIDYKLTHGQIFYLMKICDVYIMLHRVSIFDFSTLEAMYNAMPIILSDIAGNSEFNIRNNILLVKNKIDWREVKNYIENGKEKGKLNYHCYGEYFAETSFKSRYENFLNCFVKKVEKS